jgi:hypothetical protein
MFTSFLKSGFGYHFCDVMAVLMACDLLRLDFPNRELTQPSRYDRFGIPSCTFSCYFLASHERIASISAQTGISGIDR